MTTAIHDAATRVRRARIDKSLSPEDVQNLLSETDLLLQGLLSDLRLVARFQPPPPPAPETDVTSATSTDLPQIVPRCGTRQSCMATGASTALDS